jgi:hypothetical protein
MRVSGTYTLKANPSWKQVTLDEIYLECDTSSAPVNIYLFEIAELDGFWNVKIYISDISNNATNNNITIYTGGSDEIDGQGNSYIQIINNGEAVGLHIVSATQWLATESNEGGLPASNSYGLYAQTSDGAVLEDTDAPTSIVGTGVGTLSVPANTFKVGNSYIAKIGGEISVQNNNTLKIDICLNGNPIVTSGFVSLGGATNKYWFLESNFTIRTLGTTGVASIHSNSSFRTQKDGGQQFEGFVFDDTNNTTFDTIISNTLDIQVTWGTASINNSLFSDYFTLTKVY